MSVMKKRAISRRRFIQTTITGTAMSTFPTGLLARPGLQSTQGVRIGAITYSFRALPGSAEQLLGYLVELGLDTVELRGEPAEEFAGGPEPPPWPRRRPSQMSEEERAALMESRRKYQEQAREWRLSTSMEPYKRLRKMYNDAGVDIDILKLGNPDWSDEEIDYAFNVARILGARGISLEISDEAGKRMGPFATKHELIVGMHNHTQVGAEDFSFDRPISYSPYNMINLDIGHYVAGTSESPIPVIQRYHDRISHLHLKDRKKEVNGGDNVMWGQGDTPIAEVLRLLQKEQYPITAMIELEYPVPEGSSVMKEMKRCVDYCRDALS